MKFLAALAVVAVLAYALMQTLPTIHWLDETAWPRTTAPLQRVTAAGVAVLTGGTWTGTVVTVGPDRFWVSPACSGLRKLVVLAVTTVVIAWALPWTAWLGLLAALVPLTLTLNVVRVASTVWLTQHVHEQAAVGWWHEVIGLAGYGVILVGVVVAAGWVARKRRRA